MIQTQKYQRKPMTVDAIQVTHENFKPLASWCQGEIQTDGTQEYIRVRVHAPKNVRQSMAFVGDWILYTPQGYKVFTNRAFNGAYELAK